MANSLKNIEKISKALSDQNRLRILEYIGKKKDACSPCVEIYDILNLSQPTVSHHMKILVDSGLLNPEKEGRNFKYTLNHEVIYEYMSFFRQLKNP